LVYRKEVHTRSPLRVFEKSIHGGLGKGNIGVVMSRAGVGKTAFLTGLALDDLMRGRKVLHVSLEDPVERIRNFYEAIFNEIRRVEPIEDASAVFHKIEQDRMIHTYNSGELSVDKLRSNLSFLKDHAQFEPQIVILDGINFHNTSNEELAAVKEIAGEANAEIWISALTHRDKPATDPRGVDDRVVCFEDYIDVMVLLHPEADSSITIRLIKDHDNTDVTDLHMQLDPKTLMIRLD
jgi:hypothetical protein